MARVGPRGWRIPRTEFRRLQRTVIQEYNGLSADEKRLFEPSHQPIDGLHGSAMVCQDVASDLQPPSAIGHLAAGDLEFPMRQDLMKDLLRQLELTPHSGMNWSR